MFVYVFVSFYVCIRDLCVFCIDFRITECIVCVQGLDPLTFSFLLSFLFY